MVNDGPSSRVSGKCRKGQIGDAERRCKMAKMADQARPEAPFFARGGLPRAHFVRFPGRWESNFRHLATLFLAYHFTIYLI